MTTQGVETDDLRIERIVHAALGRQLRSVSLLALLLGVLGFFVGHFVAASYSRQVNERLEARLAEMQEQIGALTERCNRIDDQHAETLTAVLQIEQLHQEAAVHDAATLRELIVGIDDERAESIRELDTYVTRRLHVPPAVVTAAMNRLVDNQLLRMNRVLSGIESRVPGGGIVEMPTPDERPAVVPAPPPPPEESENRTPSPSTAPRQPSLPDPSLTAGTAPTRSAGADEFFAQPPPRGFLFISRSQPEKLDSTQVSESEAIPLPPR